MEKSDAKKPQASAIPLSRERRMTSRRLGKACAELVAHNQRYDHELTRGEPDPEAPLRCALRWSDPALLDTRGRHWIEPVAATRWRGHRAEFFGLKIDFRFYARRPIRFFLLVDDDDKADPPTPRGYIVAIGCAHASVCGVDGTTIKQFYVDSSSRYSLIPPRRSRERRYK